MSGENNMAPVNTPLMDAPTLGWGERMLSKKDIEKIDYIKDLGEHAAKSNAQLKQRNADESAAHRKQREQGLTFTEPVRNEAGMPPINKGKFPRQEANDVSEGGVYHQWEITAGEEDETWLVGGGTMYFHGQGEDVTVLEGIVEGAAGVVYVQITRDPASRAASDPQFGIAETLPPSTISTNYFRLGEVGGDPAIIQDQFTPIKVYEDLFVINGEFKLANLAMMGENFYIIPE